MTAARPRMLAVVSRFKWVHINYLTALREHFDLRAVSFGEGGKGAPADAVAEGMPLVPFGAVNEIGIAEARTGLEEQIAAWQPDVIHLMYYYNEELTLLARALVGDSAVVIHECRDPLTTLR